MSDNDDDFMCDEDEEYDLVSIFFNVTRLLRPLLKKNKCGGLGRQCEKGVEQTSRVRRRDSAK